MKNILIADGHAGTFSYFRVQPMGRRFSITADTTAGREVILGTFIERSAALLAVQFIMESEAPLIDYQTLARDAAECIASIQHTDDEDDQDDHVVSFPLPGATRESMYDDNFRPVCSLKEFAERENG